MGGFLLMRKIKFTFLFLLALLIFMSFAVNAANEAANYFPLAVGNEWTYSRSGQAIGSQKILVNVTAKTQPSGSTAVYFQLNNYNGTAHWVQQSAGIVSEYPNYLWYYLNAGVGSSWTMHINTMVPGVIIGSDGAVLTVVSRNESVTVPVGTFTTVHISFRTNVCDAGITDEWFAPGFGLVKRVETSLIGPITWELVHMVINGTVIGTP
jgi:hypothetical protein